MGEIVLTAGDTAAGLPAEGQLLQISAYNLLFAQLGTYYGGDGQNTFALPDLRDAAPDGLTYSICADGTYPMRD